MVLFKQGSYKTEAFPLKLAKRQSCLFPPTYLLLCWIINECQELQNKQEGSKLEQCAENRTLGEKEGSPVLS